MPRRLLAVLIVLLLPESADAWTRRQVADYALRGERSWAALTHPLTGAVTDTIAPGPHAVRDYNYGTFLLADAQLRTGDSALADTAVAHVLGLINRNGARPPGDPFNQFAAASILSDGRAGRLAAYERVRVPIERMVAQFAPFTGHGFADPSVYDNWRLVWAAAAIRIAASGLVGDPGSIAEHPARLRAEVARIVSELVPAHAGPPVRTPYGTGRVLSDPGRQPNAYHVFSAVLLEHIFETDPTVFSAAALAVREAAGRYALALMAPDGQLTHSGRSMEQSWVLAAAADLGAIRASQGGPQARDWRAFADRAMGRLVRVHGTFADGTTPVVPGLRHRPDHQIADHYSSSSQYNGLSLYLIQHAAAYWPDIAAGAPTSTGLSADLAPGGAGLVWGHAGNVWWAIQGWRAAGDDSRYSQGIVSVKVRTGGRWRELLASRPHRGKPSSDWRLKTRRGTARLALTRATGSGARAVLSGHWHVRGRRVRSARWAVYVRDGALHVTTERVRRGERVVAAVWAPPGAKRIETSANAKASAARACTVTASGRACALRIRAHRAGRVRVTFG
jgi:hypothetical protein